MDTRDFTKNHQEPRHSIAVVSQRTGISQLVLRAWERRYSAVVPARTSTGRRRYSDQDVEKLLLLAQLTAGEHRIGDIAGLSIEELRDLAREFGIPEKTTGAPAHQPAAVDELMIEALDAITALDARRLEAVLDRALVDLSKPVLRNELIVPMLEEIGQRWRDGKLRVVHEHMASSIVGAFLTSLNGRFRVSPGVPVLAVATPSGQLHELGALMAASLVLETGWDVLYLGPNLPAEDLAAAVKGRNISGILLSLIFPHGDPGTADELRQLRRLVGYQIPLIVGGQAAASYADVLQEIDARIVANLDELERALAF